MQHEELIKNLHIIVEKGYKANAFAMEEIQAVLSIRNEISELLKNYPVINDVDAKPNPNQEVRAERDFMDEPQYREDEIGE